MQKCKAPAEEEKVFQGSPRLQHIPLSLTRAQTARVQGELKTVTKPGQESAERNAERQTRLRLRTVCSVRAKDLAQSRNNCNTHFSPRRVTHFSPSPVRAAGAGSGYVRHGCCRDSGGSSGCPGCGCWTRPSEGSSSAMAPCAARHAARAPRSRAEPEAPPHRGGRDPADPQCGPGPAERRRPGHCPLPTAHCPPPAAPARRPPPTAHLAPPLRARPHRSASRPGPRRQALSGPEG